MQISEVPQPKGRGGDRLRVGESDSGSKAVLVPQTGKLLGAGDEVALSDAVRARDDTVLGLVNRLQERADDLDLGFLDQMRQRVADGELARPEVIEETVRRFLQDEI